MTDTKMRGLHDFIDGQFRHPVRPDGELVVHNPADTTQVIARISTCTAHVDQAVTAARNAFRAWRKLPTSDREKFLRAYQERLRTHQEDIALAITNDVGKPLWEARTEVASMISKVDLSLGPGADYTRTEVLDALPGEVRYRPLGVVAVVGPFNFPGHLPNGQIVPSLLLGNTVVHKPSEKTPNAAVWIARCLHEAGLPPGVFNVVQGAAASSATLTGHSDIDAVAFTGSAHVGSLITKQNAHRYHLPIALELGGKNLALVLDDCDVEKTARALTFAAFVTSGQRCTATSRVLVTPGVADKLITRVAELTRALSVGHPLRDDVFMGPVINEQALAGLARGRQLALDAGYEPLVSGGRCEPGEVGGHRGHYTRPSLVRGTGVLNVPGYTDHELFGPDLAIHVVRDGDDALAIATQSAWGLAASVFTGSREGFEQMAQDLRAGVIHWNRASTGASGRLPFGGVGLSGNQRPAGILWGRTSSYPQGILLENAASPESDWPGFPHSAKE